MGELGFYFNTKRCIGCKACQVSCKEKNNLGKGIFFRRADIAAPPYIDLSCNDLHEDDKAIYYSGACNHCREPACVEVCPTGAMHKNPDETTGQDSNKCIGCGFCIWSCPHGAPVFCNKSGRSLKCGSCAQQRDEGRQPVCVEACVTNSLMFGDLEELGKQLEDDVERSCSLPENQVHHFRKDSEEVFLIIGGGVAGLCAATAIRERNDGARIVIAGKEPYLPYNRPMLTKAPLIYTSSSAYSIHDKTWYEKNRIETILNHEITAIDCADKTVYFTATNNTTHDTTKIKYDKCIYALGADSLIPPISGADQDAVITVRTLSDIEKLRRRLLNSRHAVVIGGGIIGIEVAWEVKKAGLPVTIIEINDTLMKRVLDDESARILERSVRSAGIETQTGKKVIDISLESESCDTVKKVTLEDGSFFLADLVIISAGIKPNVEVARQAGLKINKAVQVNEYMETSTQGIYACGDCAEIDGVCMESWKQSQTQGYIAGANAAGDRLVYADEPYYMTLHAAETCLFAIGDPGKKAGIGYDKRTGSSDSDENQDNFLVNKRPYGKEKYESYYSINGRLVGAVLIGDLTSMRTVKEAFTKSNNQEFQTGQSLNANPLDIGNHIENVHNSGATGRDSV